VVLAIGKILPDMLRTKDFEPSEEEKFPLKVLFLRKGKNK
jgi:hypothetical protein